MSETIIIACAGIVTTIVSYILGRKKRTVETSLLETELQKKTHEYYQQIISDTNRSLGYYIKLSEETSATVAKLEETINTILEDVCIKKNCRYRIYHQSVQARMEMQKTIKKQQEEEVKEETKEENADTTKENI